MPTSFFYRVSRRSTGEIVGDAEDITSARRVVTDHARIECDNEGGPTIISPLRKYKDRFVINRVEKHATREEAQQV